MTTVEWDMTNTFSAEHGNTKLVQNPPVFASGGKRVKLSLNAWAELTLQNYFVQCVLSLVRSNCQTVIMSNL